jgi:hypothetical protein
MVKTLIVRNISKENKKDVANNVKRSFKNLIAAKCEGNDDIMPVYSPVRTLPVIPPKKEKKVKKQDTKKIGEKGFEKERKEPNEVDEKERQIIRKEYATKEFTQADLAKIHNVSITTVFNILHSNEPKKKRGGSSFKHIKITKPIAKYMYEKVIKHPGITARILKGKISHKFQVNVAKSTINKKLMNNMAKDGFENFTFKKLYVYHTERNSPKIKKQRIRFCKLYDAYLTKGYDFLYIDESPCEIVIYQKKGRFTIYFMLSVIGVLLLKGCSR